MVVYQRQRELARRVFAETQSFPREERYSLTDQARRASRSIGTQIAEAWAKRRYVRHFAAKLTDADGEREETQHWIETAEDCGYLDAAGARALFATCEEIGRMLNAMIDRAESFCPQSSVIREDSPTDLCLLSSDFSKE